ncbi:MULTISPECIES: hypothetical protein [Sphingobium]|jgi:ribosomal protein L28|nr:MULTISPECIES: hypothetical protein [Sphingobium]
MVQDLAEVLAKEGLAVRVRVAASAAKRLEREGSLAARTWT